MNTMPNSPPALVVRELAAANIGHGFFGRRGGQSKGLFASLNCGLGSSDDPTDVLANRATIAAHLGLRADRLITVYQIHSATVIDVKNAWSRDAAPRADAMVTSEPDIGLGILTADCTPVLFCDANAGIIGAAHAGWRGAFDGVLGATIATMEKQGARRSDIVAVIGPTISQENYEVGPEFFARFVDRDASFEAFFRPSQRQNHFMFDLPAFARNDLTQNGIGQTIDVAACTYARDEDYYSYRRTTHQNEPDYGRNLSVITLKSPG